MTVTIDHSCPEPHVGHRWRSGVHGGRRLGLDIHRHRALERRVQSAGMPCKRGDQASPPFSRSSMGLARLYDSTSAGAARGLALRMDHGSQYLIGPLHQPDQVLGHPAVLRLRRRAPDQRRRRAVQSHAEGTDHPWSHLPQHRGALRDAVRDFVELYNAHQDRRKAIRLPEPAPQARQRVAHRDLNQARRRP